MQARSRTLGYFRPPLGGSLSIQPVQAQSMIVTGTAGIDAAMGELPTSTGPIPAYRVLPAGGNGENGPRPRHLQGSAVALMFHVKQVNQYLDVSHETTAAKVGCSGRTGRGGHCPCTLRPRVRHTRACARSCSDDTSARTRSIARSLIDNHDAHPVARVVTLAVRRGVRH